MHKLFCCACVMSLSVAAEEVEVKYTYDELGRLTFMEDPLNGNRDYDYDPAGNRKVVVVGLGSDDSNVPPPYPYLPAPSDPSYVGPLTQNSGGWNYSWGSVSGAVSYEIGFPNGAIETSTGTSRGTAEFDPPSWVHAIDSNGVSGNKAYF